MLKPYVSDDTKVSSKEFQGRNQRKRKGEKKGEKRTGDERGSYIRTRSVIEGSNDFIKEGKVKFLVKVEDTLHFRDVVAGGGMGKGLCVMMKDARLEGQRVLSTLPRQNG